MGNGVFIFFALDNHHIFKLQKHKSTQMEKPLSVVGIDPGTTVGFAVLNLSEGIIEISSRKGLSLDELVHSVTSKSSPLLIGCDKVKVPKFVDKFAAKVGAKIIVPKEDMKLAEKHRIAAKFPCKNHHEEDALASALVALRKSNGLLSRVNRLVPAADKHLTEQVKHLVIKKRIAVKKAVALIKNQA